MIKDSFSITNINNNLKFYLKKTMIFGILIALIMSFSGCFLIPKEEEVLAPPLKEPPQIVYDTLNIAKGTFEKKVEVTGYLVSVTQKDLSFVNSSGRLKAIYVKIGDKVTKGALLAELVTEDFENQIKLQEINLEKAKINYSTAISTLENQISQQDINIEKLQMVYDTALNSEESQFNIKKAALDVDTEKLRLKDLKEELAKKKSNLCQAYLDIETEKLKLEKLKTQLAQSKLISPISGDVDYITNTKEGSVIDAYTTVVTIADPKDLQVAYSDDKVSEFELGMKVDLTINNVKVSGKVVTTPSDMPTDADEKTKNSIRIKMDKIPADITIGDTVYISLVQIKKENVIFINKNIIHTVGAKKFVNVIENGLKKERDIETGDENQTEVIVLKGLAEGDQVIKN